MNLRSLGGFLLNAIGLGLLAAVVLYLVAPQLFKPPVPPQTLPQPTAVVSYADAVRRAAPAVVSIITAQVQENTSGERQPQPDISLGSGVILRADGYILTNDHVIAGADTIAITLQDGRQVAADVVGRDHATDLAVLKVPLTNLPTIPLADAHPVQVGDVVMAIGNPIGIGQTVTMGIVSATGRSHLDIAKYEGLIQTDAAITYGNSGGALINAHGELIGINSAFLSVTRRTQTPGISFAIPNELALWVLDQILDNGRVIRGWLGLDGVDLILVPRWAEANHLTSLNGVVIQNVYRPGPAFDAGIQPGDILRRIDGKEIADGSEAMRRIAEAKPGSSMALQFVRKGKPLDLQVKIAEMPPDS